MKKLMYSILTLATCTLAQSVWGLVVPPAATSAGDAKGKYPEIAACAHKQEGDACMLQPNPMAMVVMSGSCKVSPADIGGVKASVLKCEPKRIPLTKPAAASTTSIPDTTSTADTSNITDTTSTSAPDTSTNTQADASSQGDVADTTAPSQGAQAGGIIATAGSKLKKFLGNIESKIGRDPAFTACKDKQLGDSCTLQPNKMAMVMMQGTCQNAPREAEGAKQIVGLKCEATPVSASDSANTVASESADSTTASSAIAPTTAPALLTETSATGAGIPGGLPQEPGLQIPTGTMPTGA